MNEFVLDPFWVYTFPWILIIGWLTYSIIAILLPWLRNLNYYVFESIPSTFVSLGLLGTFAGIAYGLSTFDTSPDLIKKSIQELLDGLKTAMYTTLAGVSLSIIFGKIIQWFVNKNYVTIPASPELDALRQLNASSSNIQATLLNLDQNAASSHAELEQLNTNFDEFQDAFLATQKDALKDGLEEVLTNFNNIMEEFIRELINKNFSKLTDSIDVLVTWQEQHRSDVANLLTNIQTISSHYEDLVNNTRTWIELMEQVAGQSSKLQKVIDEFDTAFSEEGNLSRILQDIRFTTTDLQETTSSFTKLAAELNETTASMQVTGDKIDAWTTQVTQVSDASGQMVSAVSQLRTIDQEKLSRMFASIDDLFLTYIKDLEERLAKIPVDA
jgi:methyl-accepting chemotaxis protein